tara:strand:+ start:342 stop:509 length:168 start_codon:yes stop_codon:yes gene_type:complete
VIFKMVKKKEEVVIWITWLALVIFWNYCYPEAKPIYDVVVAVILSLIVICIKKIK